MSWEESAIFFAYVPSIIKKNKLKLNNGILLTKLFLPAVRKNFQNCRLKAKNLQNVWDH